VRRRIACRAKDENDTWTSPLTVFGINLAPSAWKEWDLAIAIAIQ
jgi:hypothetical protein